MKKDIAWLKEEVEELDKEESQNYPHYYTVPLSDVRELIDQLDEPEITEEEEQKYNVNFRVNSSFGAIGIFLYKEGDEVLAGNNFRAYYPQKDEYRLTEQEIRDFQNGDILFEHFAVKVEEVEEQKYRVILQEELDEEAREIPMFFPEHKWYVHLDEKGKIAGTPELKNVPKFTEQEIKDYDPRFWPFAVKVEEVEE